MRKYIAHATTIFIDLTVLSIAYWLAFMLRFEFSPEFAFFKLLFFTWPYVVLFQYLLLVGFGVPKFSWRYIGLKEMKHIVGALAVASTVLVGLRLGLIHVGGYARFVVIPLGVLGMNFVLCFLGIAGVRVLRRIVAEREERGAIVRKTKHTAKRTLLIGAGRAGVMVAKEVVQNPALGIKVVGFADDDTMKIGTIIQGHKVLGDCASMASLVKEHQVEQAVISIAAASGSSIRSIVNACEENNLPVKIIPGIYEILGGKVNLSRMREVTIEDLLGREAVELDLDAIHAYLTGKRVLVTGAGGSIGSEICRQVLNFQPQKLLLVERAENALFNIHRELLPLHPNQEIVPCIADVTDQARMDKLFAEYKPQVVFHAAAHKHVPMMEYNPGEAIKNNVFGTKVLADTADKYKVDSFVMISTDKAVNPTSIMGTSKRIAELYVQGLSQKSSVQFEAVRFGNVLGSAGSVIPIFKEQIEKGGPVTVTHPDMQRYFMTIPEACQLVMQSATMGAGGEIFVLDMGKPVFIKDLARDLINLSGYSENEIEIKYSGLRPGEKLFEELSTESENMTKTRHPRIFIGKIASHSFSQISKELAILSQNSNCLDNDVIRQLFGKIVPEMIVSDEAILKGPMPIPSDAHEPAPKGKPEVFH